MMMMAEGFNEDRPEREHRTMMSFESLGMEQFYLSASAVLSLYAAGRTTGTVVDIGHQQTAVGNVPLGLGVG